MSLYDILKICHIGFRHFVISLLELTSRRAGVLSKKKEKGCWRPTLLEANDVRNIYKMSAIEFPVCVMNGLIHGFGFLTVGLFK